MQKGKRYRVMTKAELEARDWVCAGGRYFHYFGQNQRLRGIVIPAADAGKEFEASQIRTYGDGTQYVFDTQESGAHLQRRVIGRQRAEQRLNWDPCYDEIETWPEYKARCTHTNPDGSAAWVNQGFMHVLEACKFCGDKKP